MAIEHRPAFKCAKHPDLPVWSGLLAPNGEQRHFHGDNRYMKCWGAISSKFEGVEAQAEPANKRAFLETLKRDDLVQATCLGNSNLHVVAIKRKPPPDQKKDPDVFEGDSLCETQVKWLWHPQMGSETVGRELCKRCHQLWRGLGSPPLRGAITASATKASIENLPLAWQEVQAEGLEGDIKEEPSGTNQSVREVLRWRRGERYVRIVEVLWPEEDDETKERKNRHTHQVHWGWVGEPKTDAMAVGWNLDGCLQKAREMMVLGGSRSEGGNRGRWTGRTVTIEECWTAGPDDDD